MGGVWVGGVSGEEVSGGGVSRRGRTFGSREFSEAVCKIFSSELFQGPPMVLFRFNVSTNHPPLSPHSRPSCHNLYSPAPFAIGGPPAVTRLLISHHEEEFIPRRCCCRGRWGHAPTCDFSRRSPSGGTIARISTPSHISRKPLAEDRASLQRGPLSRSPLFFRAPLAIRWVTSA